MYQLTVDPKIVELDGVFIPEDLENPDWLRYQVFLSSGGTPTPAVEAQKLQSDPLLLSLEGQVNTLTVELTSATEQVAQLGVNVNTLQQAVTSLQTSPPITQAPQ